MNTFDSYTSSFSHALFLIAPFFAEQGVLPVPQHVKDTVDPNAVVFNHAKDPIANFKKVFKFHKAPDAKEAETKRRVWSEVLPLSPFLLQYFSIYFRVFY